MPGARFRLATLSLCAWVLASTACGPVAPEQRAPERFSILAVGDTGLPLGAHDGQARVAEMLAAEDAAHPVDGLLLLGDNFYPRGLSRDDLALRIGHNVLTPYCRFVTPGPRAAETGSPCVPSPRPGRTIWAVLGNHDTGTPESPRLEREAVPAFVANWRMNDDVVEVLPVGKGVQLVLVDSTRLVASDPDLLRAAVDAAPGPWRIVAGHYPIVDGWGASDGLAAQTTALHDALASARHRVQLILSGHEHNLQAFRPADGVPALHVIAGGGSSARKIEPGPDSRVFARETRGFARVAILRGPPERLLVELIATPKPLLGLAARRERVARFEIGVDGTFYASEPAKSVSP